MKIKILGKIIFFSLVIFSADMAYANDSVDLKVSMTLTSGACTPSLENNGLIDLGHIPKASLVDSGGGGRLKIAANKIYSFDITCASATKVGFTVTDNKAGTVPEVFSSYLGMYGFGTTSDSSKIGAFQIYGNKMSVDGVTAKFIYSNTSGATWNGASAITSGSAYWYSWAIEGNTPVEGKNFHVAMDTKFYFAQDTVNKISDELPFSGNATFTVVYL